MQLAGRAGLLSLNHADLATQHGRLSRPPAVAFGAPAFGFPPEPEASAAAEGLDDLAETEASELAEVFRGAEEVVPPEAEDSALAAEDLSGSGGAIGC